MSLGEKLAFIFVAFCAAMAAVMFVAFRERKLGRAIADDDYAAQRAQDGRVLVAIFGAAIAGMLLTILVAWLIFL